MLYPNTVLNDSKDIINNAYLGEHANFMNILVILDSLIRLDLFATS